MNDTLGTLYLLPNLLAEETSRTFLPNILDEIVPSLDGLIAESEKEGRKYLKLFPFPEGKTFRDIPIKLLNEHTLKEDIDPLVDPILDGQNWGLVSDCGLPCLADPGASLVLSAKREGITIELFPGPSAVVSALMLSGLSGQSFAFQGYLPRELDKLKTKVTQLAQKSSMDQQTQLFIEAPYRSEKLFIELLKILPADTLLSIASNLTLPDQITETKSIRAWKEDSLPSIHKKPTVFLFLASQNFQQNRKQSDGRKNHFKRRRVER